MTDEHQRQDDLASVFLAIAMKVNALRREVDGYVDAIGDDDEYIQH